jgi:hypothetical protein
VARTRNKQRERVAIKLLGWRNEPARVRGSCDASLALRFTRARERSCAPGAAAKAVELDAPLRLLGSRASCGT